jgi:hypothetical protein
MKMKNVFWILLTILVRQSCKTVPVTGRKQLNLVPTP